MAKKKSPGARRIWFAALCAVAATLCTQAQVQVEEGFNPPLPGAPQALALQADGKILAAGSFCLGRVNPDGIVDTTFDADLVDPGVIAVQADGRILVAATEFWSFHLRRYGTDGSLDATFNVVFDGPIRCLAVQPDGKIIVGGDFSMVAGESRLRIARLKVDGTLDPTFYAYAGPESYFSIPSLTALAVQADGRIVVGGSFTWLNGQACTNVGRLYPDGTFDPNFYRAATSEYDIVSGLVLQPDGKIVVTGIFFPPDLLEAPPQFIRRLNATGTLDASFRRVTNLSVSGLAMQADGKILISGASSLPGDPSYVSRLNADGSVDSSFYAGADGPVSSLALQADGKVLAGGSYTNLGGQPHQYLARILNNGAATNRLTLDGSTATWWQGGTGPNLTRTTFEASTDGATWTSLGSGTRISGGWQRSGLALPANATICARGFVPANGSGWFLQASLGPPAIVRQPNSRALNAGARASFAVEAAGSATLAYQWWKDGVALTDDAKIAGSSGPVLVLTNAWHPDAGDYWVVITNSYGSITSAVAVLTVDDPCILTQPSSRTVSAESNSGFSVIAAGTPPLGYQWRKDGVDLIDGRGVSGAATPELLLSNVFHPAGGEYCVVVSNCWGMVTSAVATLTVNDPAIIRQPANSGANPGGTAVLNVTAVGTRPLSYQWYRDSTNLPGATTSTLTITNFQAADAGYYRVVVTNEFGSTQSASARLVLSMADPFNPGAPGGYVESLAVQPDGKILAGGLFTRLAGQTRTYAGRVNADGTPDIAFNPRADYCVNCLAVEADGDIFLGGHLGTLGGRACNHIGRLSGNGAPDTNFLARGDYHYLNSLVVQPDGKVLVGGTFGKLVRLDRNGTPDTSFYPPTVYGVNCVALQPDGKILLGGSFVSIAGQPRGSLGRLNPDGTLDTNFTASVSDSGGPGWGPGVMTLAVMPSGKILVGGNFGYLSKTPHACLGCLNSDGTVDTNFTAVASGTVHSFALQADGKILVGGEFVSLRSLANPGPSQLYRGVGRLHANGTVDTNFTNPDISGQVLALALQPDGKIVVGGTISSFSGLMRTNIGRLLNTDPATNNLGFDGSTITWTRGGTAPEVWRTTFEYSTDGTNWSGLGAGTRIAGGWQLTNVSVPPTAALRARGYVTGGHYNASGSVVESLLDRTPPRIVCPADIAVTNAHDAWTSVVTFSPAVSDNLPGVGAPVCEPPSGTAFDVGAHTVNCSITDAAGNSNQCSFQVTVWPGNVAPVPLIRILPGKDCGAIAWPGRGETNLLVLACNGLAATVVCDGSRSSDPEGDSFSYAWFDGTVPFSTERVAVRALPLGTRVITLRLNDGFPYGTNSASASVEVISPSQAVALMIGLVENSQLSMNRQHPLVVSLLQATAAVGRGSFNAALGELGAFELKVRAQVAGSNPALAQTLLAAADRIIAALESCGQHGRPVAVRSLTRHGKTSRLDVTASPGQVCIVEASANLTTWEAVGVAVERGGSLEFEDPDASKHPTRFYRLASP